ncbi:hypothetical protein BDR05DRAFT_883335, partial [Suillus weaverae]
IPPKGSGDFRIKLPIRASLSKRSPSNIETNDMIHVMRKSALAKRTYLRRQ